MKIQLRGMEKVPPKYHAEFYQSANLLGKVIVGPATGYPKSLVIEVTAKSIDDKGAILGYAAPETCYPQSCYSGEGLPSHGYMVFDTADLDEMQKEHTLFNVSLHEMLHVCGLGTLWEVKNLVEDLNTDDPVYIGKHAVDEYRLVMGDPSLTSIPVENEGGVGTIHSHWRKRVFGNEVFIGEITGESQPLSRITIGALEDLGYVVNYDYAEHYQIDTEGLEAANDDDYYATLAGDKS